MGGPAAPILASVASLGGPAVPLMACVSSLGGPAVLPMAPVSRMGGPALLCVITHRRQDITQANCTRHGVDLGDHSGEFAGRALVASGEVCGCLLGEEQL